MTCNQYIEGIKTTNKTIFAGQCVNISSAALENALRMAFDAGHTAGIKLAREIKADESESVFKRVFGN